MTDKAERIFFTIIVFLGLLFVAFVVWIGCGVHENSAGLVERIKEGGVVEVEPGTYFVPEIILTGRRDLHLKAADPSNLPVFRSNIGRPFAVRGGSNVTIDGIHFHFDANNAFHLELYGSNLTVQNSKFTGVQPKHGAIIAGGENIKIIDNEGHLEGGGGTQDHFVYINVGRGRTLTKGVEISGNNFSGSTGYICHIWEQDGSTGTLWAMSDLGITGNVLTGSRQRSGLIIAHGTGGSISNVLVQNNRTSGNAYRGYVVRNGRDIRLIDNVADEVPAAEISPEAEVELLGNSWQTGEPPVEPPGDEPPSKTVTIINGTIWRHGEPVKFDSLKGHVTGYNLHILEQDK